MDNSGVLHMIMGVGKTGTTSIYTSVKDPKFHTHDFYPDVKHYGEDYFLHRDLLKLVVTIRSPINRRISQFLISASTAGWAYDPEPETITLEHINAKGICKNVKRFAEAYINGKPMGLEEIVSLYIEQWLIEEPFEYLDFGKLYKKVTDRNLEWSKLKDNGYYYDYTILFGKPCMIMVIKMEEFGGEAGKELCKFMDIEELGHDRSFLTNKYFLDIPIDEVRKELIRVSKEDPKLKKLMEHKIIKDMGY